jgi:hypothetical protein
MDNLRTTGDLEQGGEAFYPTPCSFVRFCLKVLRDLMQPVSRWFQLGDQEGQP